MRKLYTFVLVLISLTTFAQERHLNYERYLIAGDQSSMLIKDYLNPALVGMMNTASSGWYSTADTHKRFGFDFTVSFVGAFVPSEDATFDISKYNNIIVEGGHTEMPTIYGEKEDTPGITSSIFNPSGGKMRAPNGLGINPRFAPSPIIQGGIGIGWGTEIKVRFIPKVHIDGLEVGMWGLAFQHDIGQYIPVFKRLPLSLSALIGYTKANATWTFNEEDNQWLGSNQHTDYEASAHTFQLLGSTNFPIINAYAGIGYNMSTASYKMYGEYIIDDNNGNVNTVVDPANAEWKHSGFTATVGARLSLASFKIFADYSIKEYNTVNLGFALSFR